MHIVVDHHRAVVFAIGGAHRADLHAGRLLALHAGDGHVGGVLLGHRRWLVVVLSFEHLAGRAVGVAADLDAQAFRIALVHLLGRELAAFHAQHLDPLDALAGSLTARLVVLLDAGLHAAAAADALAHVQRIAHQHTGLRTADVDGDLLSVFRRVAFLQAQTRFFLLLLSHQPIVLLEMLGPFDCSLGVARRRHQCSGPHQRRHAQHAARPQETAA
jgi:hypothetical protein